MRQIYGKPQFIVVEELEDIITDSLIGNESGSGFGDDDDVID